MYWIKNSGVFALAAIVLFCGCFPKKKPSSSSTGKNDELTNSLGISMVKVGSSFSNFAEINNGNYYSKYSDVKFFGTCNGNVAQIKVGYTPFGGSVTEETVACSSSAFSWAKNLTSETNYSVVFTPLDTTSATVSDVPVITKSYTYDTTAPAIPTFISPTTDTSFNITDGSTSVTIIGQVLNEVVKLIGPSSVQIPLIADADLVHKNYVYNVSVPAGSNVSVSFTAYDLATNTSTVTMNISSAAGLNIPIASQEIGGSRVNSGLRIDSSVGFMSDVIINNNVKHITGSAAIMGNF
jgi:hypothetical protein